MNELPFCRAFKNHNLHNRRNPSLNSIQKKRSGLSVGLFIISTLRSNVFFFNYAWYTISGL